ncbi:MAG: TatD family hydrolase [Candidatus Hodarchaeales archaeon]|jgi:TatD DNase family protein
MAQIHTLDSHAHLFPRWFKHKTDRAAQEAKNHGIGVINSAIDPKDYDFGVKFSKKHENVFLTLGLAPQGIVKYRIDVQAALERLTVLSDRIVAVGEVGLDYHWVKDQKGRQIQRKAFLQAIRIANDQELPIVIHSRKAELDCMDILEKNAQTDVILHCFAGAVSEATRAVSLGWYISIPTAVTQRRVHRRLAEAIPLNNLIVETDSPFLSPDPRVRTNTPTMITRAIEEIARLKHVSYDEVREATFRNCGRIFGLGL